MSTYVKKQELHSLRATEPIVYTEKHVVCPIVGT